VTVIPSYHTKQFETCDCKSKTKIYVHTYFFFRSLDMSKGSSKALPNKTATDPVHPKVPPVFSPVEDGEEDSNLNPALPDIGKTLFSADERVMVLYNEGFITKAPRPLALHNPAVARDPFSWLFYFWVTEASLGKNEVAEPTRTDAGHEGEILKTLRVTLTLLFKHNATVEWLEMIIHEFELLRAISEFADATDTARMRLCVNMAKKAGERIRVAERRMVCDVNPALGRLMDTHALFDPAVWGQRDDALVRAMRYQAFKLENAQDPKRDRPPAIKNKNKILECKFCKLPLKPGETFQVHNKKCTKK
jgi:hypothetical protein